MNLNDIKEEPLLTELWHNESKALLSLKSKYIVNATDIIEKGDTVYVYFIKIGYSTFMQRRRS